MVLNLWGRRPWRRELRSAAGRKKLTEKHGSYDSTRELTWQVFPNPDIGSMAFQVRDDHLPIPLPQGSIWKKLKLLIVFKNMKIACVLQAKEGQ